MNIQQVLSKATSHILKDNLLLKEEPYNNKEIVLVYDTDCELSELLAEAYKKELCSYSQVTVINFSELSIEKREELTNKLNTLEEHSTVILVQSTNFRLDDFRIRMSLQKKGVGCLEHNHLSYIKADETMTYAEAISYKTDLYSRLKNKLKGLSDHCSSITFECEDGSTLTGEGGLEDMKDNIGDYEGRSRGSTFPIGEVFTEIQDFDSLNGELSIYCVPGFDYKINMFDPFKIRIEKSRVYIIETENTPQLFIDIYNKIKEAEDGEVFVRELGFGLNDAITKQKVLSDVNAYERIAGFHVSLGKKHGIYRKKMHRKVTQRYHIDIFPDIKNIYIDDTCVMANGKYTI